MHSVAGFGALPPRVIPIQTDDAYAYAYAYTHIRTQMVSHIFVYSLLATEANHTPN